MLMYCMVKDRSSTVVGDKVDLCLLVTMKQSDHLVCSVCFSLTENEVRCTGDVLLNSLQEVSEVSE